MKLTLLAVLAMAAVPDPEVVVAPASAPLTPAAGAETVEVQTDRYRRLTVPVHIDGQGPFDFMVDTGSEATVVTNRLRERVPMAPAGSAVVVGMASRVPVELVALDGLEFAARVFDNLRVPLLDANHVGADGILGLDTLQDLRVLIDFRADTMAVDDGDSLGGNSGYEIVIRARRKLGRLIITDATIDKVRTAVILDTGAQSSIGNMALQRRLRARKRETISSKDVNGFEISGTVDLIKSLRIDAMQLTNLPIMFADGPAFAQLGLADRPAMILGIQDLRVFDRVAIDFASRQILFDTPASAADRPRVQLGGNPSRL